ncbi:MAG: DnaA regulatory inactivator Hda [Thiolinea sp.]
MNQLTLNVTLPDHPDFAGFFPDEHNREIWELLQSRLWINFPQIVICGEAGSGKSHLLQACCHQAYAEGETAAYLGMRDLVGFGAGVLEGLDNTSLLVLDDVDVLIGNRAWEEALYHLINRCREQQQPLLMSARHNPHELNCLLPDLGSRLLWGPIYHVRPLDEQQALQAFIHRAELRGLDIPAQVVAYIGRHFPRDMPSLMRILERLDDASLINGKKVTRPLVLETLQPGP